MRFPVHATLSNFDSYLYIEHVRKDFGILEICNAYMESLSKTLSPPPTWTTKSAEVILTPRSFSKTSKSSFYFSKNVVLL